MNQTSSELMSNQTNNGLELMEQGLAMSDENPTQALILLEESARHWLQHGDKRRAAFVLHQRAGLRLKNEQSPVKDLAMAARLLAGEPNARAVVLLDLGQALAQEKDFRRAALALRESEKLARQANNTELIAAARYALGDVSSGGGDFAGARTHLRQAGFAMIYDIENDLLTTLHNIGNLPNDARAKRERARRAQAVEDELAALKQEMGLA